MIYSANEVVINNRVIPLCHIESMRLPVESDATVDKLLGDCHFEITTLSGKDYTISCNENSRLPYPPEEICRAIYSKWLHIISYKVANIK